MFSFVLSIILSFVLSVSRIAHDRGNGRRPNMVGMGKRWPSIVKIFGAICMCILDQF